MVGEISASRGGSKLHFEAKPLSAALRKGKWTAEEEQYASKIISLFNRGILDIPSGTTLRSYLSEKLNW